MSNSNQTSPFPRKRQNKVVALLMQFLPLAVMGAFLSFIGYGIIYSYFGWGNNNAGFSIDFEIADTFFRQIAFGVLGAAVIVAATQKMKSRTMLQQQKIQIIFYFVLYIFATLIISANTNLK